MVIVACVALSTMISNDMLLPWLLRRKNTERPFEAFRHWMLTVRRVSIVMILLLAYVSYRMLGSTASLATMAIRGPLSRDLHMVLHLGAAGRCAQHGLVAQYVPAAGMAAQQPVRPAYIAHDPRRGVVDGRQLHAVRLGVDAVAYTGD